MWKTAGKDETTLLQARTTSLMKAVPVTLPVVMQVYFPQCPLS